MSVPYYVPWRDNLLTQAVNLTVVAGSDPEFPVTNVIDGNPAWPAKFGTTVRITAEFAAPVAAGVAAAIHHTLGDTTVLRIQGNATDSWGAPSVDVAFPTRSGLVGPYRKNALADFRALSASQKFWSFTVPTANAVAVWFGQLWLGPATAFPDDFRYDGYSDARAQEVLENLTYAGVSLRLKKDFLHDIVSGGVRARDTESLEYVALFDALQGKAEPVLVIADPKYPIARMCLLDQDTLTRALADVDAHDIALTFRELSKGLYFPLT